MARVGGQDGTPAVEAPSERLGAEEPTRVGEELARAAPEARAAGDAAAPAAIIVCHGMGQQVQFETLNLVAAALWSRQSDAPMHPAAVRVRYVAFGDDWLPRVEMSLRTRDGLSREVHLYEAYWAPITEGKVALGDVFAFLLSAGWRGVRYGARGAFDRWMFGRLQAFALPARGLYALALALAAACALALLFVTFWPLVLARAAALLFPAWETGTALRLLAGSVAWSVLAVVALAVAGVVGSQLARLAGAPPGGRGTAPRPHLAARAAAVVLGGAAVFASMWLAALAPGAIAMAWCARGLPGCAAHPWLGGALALLAVGALALVKLRSALVQYVGDVAAYVSAHEVSRFQEIRREIQAVGRRVARNVYGSRAPDGGALEYRDVLVVGHSLGSVIAYDMLNDSINRDLLLASSRGDGARLRVAERTALLLTVGSPLDKTAFLFRTQKDELPVREALAGAVQPMIVDYANRPARWINIWSPWDWISGSLEYYDACPVPAPFASRAVQNVRERGAPVHPARAHTGYWTRKEMAERLYEAL